MITKEMLDKAICEAYQAPTGIRAILMHPNNVYEIAGEIASTCRVTPYPNWEETRQFKYRGIKVFRTEDLEIDEFKVL